MQKNLQPEAKNGQTKFKKDQKMRKKCKNHRFVYGFAMAAWAAVACVTVCHSKSGWIIFL